MSHQFGKEVVVGEARGQGENFMLGLIAGLVAAGVGAAIWMQIALATGSHVGYSAILVGALVGLAVRLAGNGSGFHFGILGGLLTLGGCFAGEFLTQIQLAITPQHDFYATLISGDAGNYFSIILGNMTPLSYLIYGIGVIAAFLISMRGGG